MKLNIITIRTLRSDTTPSPSPTLIADLVEAVLRVPGLRVKSVGVAELSSEPQVVNRRIREVTAGRAKPEGACVVGKPEHI